MNTWVNCKPGLLPGVLSASRGPIEEGSDVFCNSDSRAADAHVLTTTYSHACKYIMRINKRRDRLAGHKWRGMQMSWILFQADGQVR
jgi:hypothetical protein